MKATKTRKASGRLGISLLALAACTVLAACSATPPTGSTSANLTQQKGTATNPATTALAALQPTPQPLFGAGTVIKPIPPVNQPPCGSPPKEAPGSPIAGCQPPPAIQSHPPVHPAAIAFCGRTPITVRPQPGVVGTQAICGSGFGSAEVVTLALSGRFGTTYWTTVATTAGIFQSALPASACRYSPGSVVATGNQGHVSNALPVPLMQCRMGL